jgi:hypothetical protein
LAAEGVTSPEGVLGGLIVALYSPLSMRLFGYLISRLIFGSIFVSLALPWFCFVKLPCMLLVSIKKSADDDPALSLLDVLHLLQGTSSDIENSWQWPILARLL